MTALLAAISKAGALKAVAAVGAGLAVGTVGGVAVFTAAGVNPNRTQIPATGASAILVACPGDGPRVGRLEPGEEVLVTGRSADGRWLEVYISTPLGDRAWTRAGPLVLKGGDVTSLPISTCAAAAVETQLSATLTPSSEPSSAPPSSPPPPPPPQNDPPVVANLTRAKGPISTHLQYCPTKPSAIQVFAKATDDKPGVRAELHWTPPAGTEAWKAMRQTNGRWIATLSTTADGITKGGTLRYWIRAIDADDADSTTSPASVSVKACPNTPPAVSQLVAAPSPVYADPLGVGTCPQLATFTVTATDKVDGVRAVRLIYRAPGKAQDSKAMEAGRSSKWSTSLDLKALGVGNVGAITWWTVANDTKGLPKTSPKKSLKVGRCDSGAKITEGYRYQTVYSSFERGCPVSSDLRIPFEASDQDEVSDGTLRTTVHWTATRGSERRSGDATGHPVRAGTQSYEASFSVAGWPVGNWGLDFHITTRDRFGGTTDGGQRGSEFGVDVCVA